MFAMYCKNQRLARACAIASAVLLKIQNIEARWPILKSRLIAEEHRYGSSFYPPAEQGYAR